MDDAIGVYIHVPFCSAKCHYCDFNSFAGLDRLRGPYVEALVRSIESATFGAHTSPEPHSVPRARTINFGGGTPSLLPAADVERILAVVRDRFRVDEGIEISLEANPGTVAESHLAAYRAIGVNRLSFGVQAFDDELLIRLGRIHTADAAERARLAARRAGFTNVNLDLMYGLPGQTLTIWQDTIARAIDLRPEHLSAYSLTVEDGTLFGTLERRGQLTLPDEDLVADMLELAEEALAAAGYERYEIANWSIDREHRCQHNYGYWLNQPYIGLGPGAHSWLDGRRSVAIRDPRRWVSEILAARSPIESYEEIDPSLELGETLMLGLRLSDGIDLGDIGQRFGLDLADTLASTIDAALSDGLVWRESSRLGLTPRGRHLGNEAFARFLEAARTLSPVRDGTSRCGLRSEAGR